MYDIIIIGAGPAGISAGLYAKRAGANVLIIYYGESNLDKAEKIDNYYGFVNGIDGKTLYQNGIEQAKNIGIEVLNEEVLDIKKEECFKVKSVSKSSLVSQSSNIISQNENSNTFKENINPNNPAKEIKEYEAKAVIISTGNKKLKPNIKGINEFEGKGISYCAICDGFFYKNKNVVVIGDGEFALNEANELKNIANSVKILTNGAQSNITSDFEIITKKIKQINGQDRVESIEFEDGSKIEVEGIFIAMGEAGGSDFAKKLGVILNNDSIVVDENMQTNVEGLYACGNITGGLQQISKSIYQGTIAGLAASKFCK